jgi:hypothetical protein
MIGEWKDGLPPKGSAETFLGNSKDARLWILKWMPDRERNCWAAAGFHRDGFAPEYRLLKEENRDFITSHREING